MFWYDLKLWQIFKMKHKICALSKIPIYSNLIINKFITYWGNYKYKSCKIFHLKIPFYENMFFLQKELKKDLNAK